MGAAITALLGTLLAAHLGTLLYLSRKIDDRIEDTNKRIDAHSENLNARTDNVYAEINAILRDAGELIAANAIKIAEIGVRVDANTEGIKELRKTAADAVISAKAAKEAALANAEAIKELRKTATETAISAKATEKAAHANTANIKANAEAIKELRKTATDAVISAKIAREAALANTANIKEFRKTAAFQNQLLLRNNRSLGRIEGILGARSLDEIPEIPEPAISLDEFPAELDDSMEEPAEEEIEERAEMS